MACSGLLRRCLEASYKGLVVQSVGGGSLDHQGIFHLHLCWVVDAEWKMGNHGQQEEVGLLPFEGERCQAKELSVVCHPLCREKMQ